MGAQITSIFAWWCKDARTKHVVMYNLRTMTPIPPICDEVSVSPLSYGTVTLLKSSLIS